MSLVILNNWTGTRFANDTRCQVCDQLASVIRLPFKLVRNGRTFICAVCLNQFQKELSLAILAAASFKPRLDSDDDGEPD